MVSGQTKYNHRSDIYSNQPPTLSAMLEPLYKDFYKMKHKKLILVVTEVSLAYDDMISANNMTFLRKTVSIIENNMFRLLNHLCIR